MKNKTIFISYSHDDYKNVISYCKILEKMHLDYFIDKRDIVGNPYAKKLNEVLNSCFLFIVFVSSNSLKSLNVQAEILQIFERINNNEDVVMLPIYLEEIQKLRSFDSMLFLRPFDGVVDISNKKYSLFENKIKGIYEMHCEKSLSQPRKNTYLFNNDEKEKLRLEKQQELMFAIDAPIYDKIVKNGENLCLLDVGCGTGNSIAKRVDYVNKKYHKISKVVGLEYDKELVDKAKSLHPNFRIYNTDIEDANFINNLRKICIAENIDKFDIINISFVLLHLEDAERLLFALKLFLKDDGVIFIRDVDDILTFGYPDEDLVIQKLISILGDTETAGYRKSGRRISLFLKNLNFKNIYRPVLGMSSNNMDIKDKEVFFDMCITFIIDHIENMAKRYPKSIEWKENLNFYKENINKVHELFLRNDFIYVLGTVVFVASNKRLSL